MSVTEYNDSNKMNKMMTLWSGEYDKHGHKLTMEQFAQAKNLENLDEWYPSLDFSMNLDLINLYIDHWFTKFKSLDPDLDRDSFIKNFGLDIVDHWTGFPATMLDQKFKSEQQSA